MDLVTKEELLKRIPVSRACVNCHRTHEKCDGSLPCERCKRRGKNCEYKEAGPRAPKLQKKNPPSVDSSATQPAPTKAAASGSGATGGPVVDGGSDEREAFRNWAVQRQRVLELALNTLTELPAGSTDVQASKYLLSFVSDPSAMFTCLNVSSAMLPSMAMVDPATHATADSICEAAEVLVMLTNGSLMHADLPFSVKCSKHVVQLLERLEFEFPARVRSDLLERTTVIRCALGFYYCTRGEFPSAGAVLSTAAETLRQVDGTAASSVGRGISKHISPHAQLILSTVLWSVLGRTPDFNWARIACSMHNKVFPRFGFIHSHAIRRMHTDLANAVDASKLIYEDLEPVFESSLAHLDRNPIVAHPGIVKLMGQSGWAIVCMDVGHHQQAIRLATSVLTSARFLSQNPNRSWFWLGSAVGMAYKVLLYLSSDSQTLGGLPAVDFPALISQAIEMMTQLSHFFPVISHFAKITPKLHAMWLQERKHKQKQQIQQQQQHHLQHMQQLQQLQHMQQQQQQQFFQIPSFHPQSQMLSPSSSSASSQPPSVPATPNQSQILPGSTPQQNSPTTSQSSTPLFPAPKFTPVPPLTAVFHHSVPPMMNIPGYPILPGSFPPVGPQMLVPQIADPYSSPRPQTPQASNPQLSALYEASTEALGRDDTASLSDPSSPFSWSDAAASMGIVFDESIGMFLDPDFGTKFS